MREFVQRTGLLVFIAFLAMAFRPPNPEEALRAIGSTRGLPMILQRAFDPGTDFSLIPVPKPGDWLAEHPERGQTFDDFKRLSPTKPDTLRDKIYLQPLGEFPEGRSVPLETLKAYGTAFFCMDVKILPPVTINGSQLRTRINPYTGDRQVFTPDILIFLRSGLPPDAFCLLAITMEDLYPHPSWNFVFGQASLRDRVGVFSFARYDPAFYGEERGRDYQEILVRRTCKVLTHEIGHMFSLHHCLFFRCVMNGSNHLQESDARPLSLCPVCLRKLHFSIGFDVADRYRKLLWFYQKAGFDPETRWVANRLKRIVGENEGK
jgi:archaemetzincin